MDPLRLAIRQWRGMCGCRACSPKLTTTGPCRSEPHQMALIYYLLVSSNLSMLSSCLPEQTPSRHTCWQKALNIYTTDDLQRLHLCVQRAIARPVCLVELTAAIIATLHTRPGGTFPNFGAFHASLATCKGSVHRFEIEPLEMCAIQFAALRQYACHYRCKLAAKCWMLQ